MQKKVFIAGAALCAFGFVVASSGAANAQLFPYTGTSATPSSSVINATTTATSTGATTTASSVATAGTSTGTTLQPAGTGGTSTPAGAASGSTSFPSVSASPVPLAAGYLQLDGLTVTSVSPAETVPTQIIATAPALGAQCEQFSSDSATAGTSVACPVPTATTTPTSATSSPTYYNPYVIVVNSASHVETSDRLPTTVGTIMPGDTINVYGYYDGTGTVDAEIVRDRSRSSSPMSAVGVAGTESAEVGSLQAQLNHLETLVMQLAAELGINTMFPSGASSCPMIPAGATSTTGCVPASSSSVASGTLYE